MSKLYLPYASQFDSMNEHLKNIVNALGSDIDISTWAGIQRAVRVGVAPTLIPVGTQLVVNHSEYGEKLYDVVAHNYFKSVHDYNAYTMTLMSHDAIATVQYDAPEAFYYAYAELPAGTYNFTLTSSLANLEAGTYAFTLANPLPKGGQLCLEKVGGEYCVFSYADQNTTGDAHISEIVPGNDGTSLGTMGVELNHPQRIVNGSNNYLESAIRQFLNSSSESGSVWKPQTKFDRPPSWKDTLPGFVRGFDEEFLSVVGEVMVNCSANDTYEAPDSITMQGTSYLVVDKFYLASQAEITGTHLSVVPDGSAKFPYYDGATNADRIKYINGSAASWWLRSAHKQSGSVVRFVRAGGDLYNDEVRGNLYVVPVCTIV